METTEHDLAALILAALQGTDDDPGLEPVADDIDREETRSFEDAGVMSSDAGLVITTLDGRQFQVSIVRSR